MKEVVIDTNIFIRFFTGDIKEQYEESIELFKRIEGEKVVGYVSILVINEIIWIMESFYNIKRNIYIPKLLSALSLKKIKIMEVKKDFLLKVIEQLEKSNLDFTDLYLFHAREHRKIVTFDKKLNKLLSNS